MTAYYNIGSFRNRIWDCGLFSFWLSIGIDGEGFEQLSGY